MTAVSVLVVEDDDDIRESLVELLERWGLRPIPARSALVALRILREGARPDVILLDLRMPGLSGWEFRRVQMDEPSLAEIPVVVMTALGGDHEAMLAQLGDVLLLPKPFAPKALADAIDGVRSR
jgi:two-component system, chemotaxis family, chemotaxis protein CheY